METILENKSKPTVTTYLEWDELQRLLVLLRWNKKWKQLLLFAIGCYTGMRIGDIRVLTWKDIFRQDKIIYLEGKTSKQRVVFIPIPLKKIINLCHFYLQPKPDDWVIVNQNNERPCLSSIEYTIKYTIRKYKIRIPPDKNISAHMLRKTFGRRVWDIEGQTDKALILLMDMFNHSSSGITRRYLGIRSDEMEKIYLKM